MSTEHRLSRRRFLHKAAFGTGLALAGPVLAACQPVPQVVEEGATEAAVAEEAVTPMPATKEAVTVRIQAPAGWIGQYVHEMAEEYMEAHPAVNIVPEDTVYAEIPTKTETGFISGTLQDICHCHNRWFFYSCYQGIYRAIDDLVAVSPPPDFEDFYPSAMEGCRFEGQLYALPIEKAVGGNIMVSFNRGLIEEAGAKVPEPGWTMDDWKELALKCTNREKGIFGLSLDWGDMHRTSNFTRSFGKPGSTDSWLVSPDGKEFWFDGRPVIREAFEWYLELAHKYRAAPLAGDEVEGGLFNAGRLATRAGSDQTPGMAEKQIGDRWPFKASDAVLLPVGPEGRQGTCFEMNGWAVSTKSQVADVAYDVICKPTSAEAILATLRIAGRCKTPRHSVALHPEVLALQPSYRDLDELTLTQGIEPFPMIWNFRYVEANDVYKNESDPLFLGNKSWDEQAPVIQSKVQQIVDLPRPPKAK